MRRMPQNLHGVQPGKKTFCLLFSLLTFCTGNAIKVHRQNSFESDRLGTNRACQDRRGMNRACQDRLGASIGKAHLTWATVFSQRLEVRDPEQVCIVMHDVSHYKCIIFTTTGSGQGSVGDYSTQNGGRRFVLAWFLSSAPLWRHRIPSAGAKETRLFLSH